MSTNNELRIFEILDDFRERLTRIETSIAQNRCANPSACVELRKEVDEIKSQQHKAVIYGTLIGGVIVGAVFGIKEAARKALELFTGQ